MATEQGAVVPAQGRFIKRTYDEAMDLMIEARNYMRYTTPRQRGGETGDGRRALHFSCEAMRVTSRLTQVIAWLLVRRAVEAGEMTPDEALAEAHRLSGQTVCLDETSHHDEALPMQLRSLLFRSYCLYQQVERLERMTRATLN